MLWHTRQGLCPLWCPRCCNHTHCLESGSKFSFSPCVIDNMTSGSVILLPVPPCRRPHGAVQCLAEVPYMFVHREVASNRTHEQQPQLVITPCSMQRCSGFEISKHTSMHRVCMFVRGHAPAHGCPCFFLNERGAFAKDKSCTVVSMAFVCVAG